MSRNDMPAASHLAYLEVSLELQPPVNGALFVFMLPHFCYVSSHGSWYGGSLSIACGCLSNTVSTMSRLVSVHDPVVAHQRLTRYDKSAWSRLNIARESTLLSARVRVCIGELGETTSWSLMLSLSPVPFLALLLVLQVAHAVLDNHGFQRGSRVHWGPCDRSVVNDTPLECATFEVPLDYHNPNVGKARLAVIKANATGERRGTVFFNPGGPGVSGLQGLVDNKNTLLLVTGGFYDIVSWDPRGVGLTVPGEIFCFNSVEEYNAFFNGTIEQTGILETGNFTDPAEIQALLSQAPIMEKKYEQVGKQCLHSSNGKFLRYLGTAAAVRDMVSLADALDGPDAPINYAGVSYGTLIGSCCLVFPERVGRVLLDGVVNPVMYATQELSTHWAQQLVSADTIYKAFITGCALTGPKGCAAASEGNGPLEIDAKVQALIKAASDATRANPSVPLTLGQLRSQLYNAMYEPLRWSNFVNEDYPEAVKIIQRESGQNISSTRRTNTLKRQSHANDTRSYTTPAIYCGDSVDLNPHTNMTDVFNAVITGAQNVSHLFSALWPDLSNQCSFWPVRSVERYQGPFNKKLANKILVASNIYDPITTLAGAQVVAGLLGDSAVLVQLNGFGHTTVAETSNCMNAIIFGYMVNGTVPENNTVCEVDADFELFDGVTTADVLANLPKYDN
ncbi:TAP-like protein-domain-containing protein [Fomes fomentarius]|nr:TAP-like protein-domain-containing protein [Fomes fomentarius]